MKKTIVITVAIIILILLIGMSYSSFSSLNKQAERESISKTLSSTFENLGIEATVPSGFTMLVYFNSECEHCQWEIKQFGKNIDKFSNLNLAFVSLEPADSALNFLKKHSLNQYFINTNPEYIMSTFSEGVPQIFIYEGNELKKKFRGEVKVEVLLEAIEN